MSSLLRGGCLCGAIRFECRGAPVFAAFCHCRHCQKAHAAPYSAAVLMAPGSIALVSGEPRRYTAVADNGASTFREFCGQCGTHLFSGGEAFPQFKTIKIATLDDPEAISPIAHMWTENLIQWARIADGLPHFPKQAELADLKRLWEERHEVSNREHG
jgi:hypothetical protein